MSDPVISVIIPTHNRPELLRDLVADLGRQTLAAGDYEVIVVDDGSEPPAALPEAPDGPDRTLIRLAGGERSLARNAGASAARGRLLVFLDDDMSVGEDFLASYLRAEAARPGSILVGESLLPAEALRTPFGRFRQFQIERVDRDAPVPPNFCAAGNMAIPAALFHGLGGFDRGIVSGEDQDLALRHSSLGGPIAFVPEARSLHRDRALDIRSYCRRVEWGGMHYIPFCRRYPEWPDNVERERRNGYFVPGTEPWSSGARKLAKALLGLAPMTGLLFGITAVLERVAPESRALERLYSLLIGIFLFRGYRRGLRHFGAIAPARDAAGRGTLQGEHAAR